MKKLIKVVGAIIENEHEEVLCALRSTKMTLPNLWEFPGGKIENGESISDAIIREIKEELKCDIEFIDEFNDNTHEYENFIVNLITLKCRIIGGNPIANEHDKLIWMHKKNLLSLKWAPADVPAVKLLIKES
ncbi:(deoxy)nucleoside triphosphate pyrophosphohydrolase [Clostridium sp. MSJ-11]|uniref:(Deoxy)nucleoside triphosphate pyrophosphohydrolase n=1 Tax=Clostridium mobile TaxID=2841512 RepID=A0ABS6EFZ5_9CLOT|nr:(deoxy)nucleoside triphosphate pyrophosphohydrolase [Clostridium mobile]MBU5484144.1 (deoxy)nucleoside triphosphate pyrophosphohydrolase [Clostridium mobile]